jgi:hypothetical protein
LNESAVQNTRHPSLTGGGRRVGRDGKVLSLDMLSSKQDLESEDYPDVESGKIQVVTVLEQHTEQVNDTTDGASDRNLVSIGSAC